ncbi:MAG TPA: hypothetical protein VL426_03400 [Candidatus Binatia bacterium]|jgi:hypothetical protein|nr:hypothetical protein [Candidatus Binatia bacterium]
MTAAPKGDTFMEASRLFFVGFLATFVLTGLVLAAPERFFPAASADGQGLRLVRDRYEIAVYYERSDWVASGALPYSAASHQEYPPLGALYIAFPRYFTDDLLAFEAISLARSAVCFGLLFAVTGLLLRKFGRPRRLLLFFFLPAFLYFSLWRYDTFPALFASLAVLAVDAGSFGAAIVALWAGVAAKIYPGFFLLPLFLRLEGVIRQPKVRASVAKGLVAVLTVSAAFLLAARVLGLSPVSMVLGTHASRPFEVGSVRELLLRWLWGLGMHPEIARGLIAVSFGLLQFGAFLPLINRVKVKDSRSFVRACLYLLIPFIAFGWFFSQQWIIWIAPLLILVAGPGELVMLGVLDLLLFLQFPVLYDIDFRAPAFDAVTVARTFVLCWLWWANARALSRERA